MDLASFSNELIAAATKSHAAGVALLKRSCPAVVTQIQRDSARRGPLSFWGRSRNFDENAHAIVVEPVVLNLIADIAGRRVSVRTPHAGLQHTYGYLFSTIETPYGFKRDRWVEANIAADLGLDSTLLSPTPSEGTLLANATWVSAAIAYRGFPSLTKRLVDYLDDNVASELTSFTVATSDHVRVTEKVKTRYRKDKRSFALQSDLVTTNPKNGDSLLVYSVVDDDRRQHQLITVFPISAESRHEICALAKTVDREDIRTRYNAYVPALGTRVHSGSCRLESF